MDYLIAICIIGVCGMICYLINVTHERTNIRLAEASFREDARLKDPILAEIQLKQKLAEEETKRFELEKNSLKPSFTCAHTYEEVARQTWEEGDPISPIEYKNVLRECTKCGASYTTRL